MVEAVQAFGNLVSGVAGYETGKANKKIAEINAVDAEREGAAEEERIRWAARAAMGQQIAAQGSNGFQIGTGSALDAIGESQINATLDALNARRRAAAQARSLRTGGAFAMSAGKNAMTAGLFGAASNLAQGADWTMSKSGASGGGK